MNLVLSIQRVHIHRKGEERKAFRRVISVDEIADYEDYRNVLKWKPAKDHYLARFDKSIMLSSISERLGMTKKELMRELQRRKEVLHWMRENKIRSYKDVAAIIAEYYARPDEFYQKILTKKKVKIIATSK
jgi:flagellar protein FlaI